MAKWADFLISAVRYNTDHKHIDQVKAHQDNGDAIGEAKVYTRQVVIDAINKGTTFITIYKDNVGKWSKGQKVFVVTVNNRKYIKTVENNKEEDNLENLPEF